MLSHAWLDACVFFVEYVELLLSKPELHARSGSLPSWQAWHFVRIHTSCWLVRKRRVLELYDKEKMCVVASDTPGHDYLKCNLSVSVPMQ